LLLDFRGGGGTTVPVLFPVLGDATAARTTTTRRKEGRAEGAVYGMVGVEMTGELAMSK